MRPLSFEKKRAISKGNKGVSTGSVKAERWLPQLMWSQFVTTGQETAGESINSSSSSQSAMNSMQSHDSAVNVRNRSQIATSSHGGRRHCPWAFTKHGAIMAANILPGH